MGVCVVAIVGSFGGETLQNKLKLLEAVTLDHFKMMTKQFNDLDILRFTTYLICLKKSRTVHVRLHALLDISVPN